jgi:thiol:disulfide interchange protein DsbG
MFKAAFLFLLTLLLAVPALAAEKTAVKTDAAGAKASAGKPAAEAKTTGEPDIANMAFMENLRLIGAKIFFMGDTGGLHGWFVVKGKEVQTVYTTPDNRFVLLGTLLDASGGNISQKQIHDLSMTHPDLVAMLQPDGAPPAANPPAAAAAEDEKPIEDNKNPKAAASEKLYVDLQKATGLTFGADAAPRLMMVMDVNCPFCHRTFKALQPLVDAGKLRLTLVPIQALGPKSAAMAAIWLALKDPYDAFKKQADGDAAALTTGTPDPKLAAAVYANTQLIRKWGIDQIPYLFYRGKNGKIRMIIGEPKDVQTVMDDIAPGGAEEKK